MKCLDPVHTFPARFSHEQLEAVAELERLCCGSLPEATSYAGVMATMFIQQSSEYIQQIEAEIERLQQLRAQVRATIQSEEQLENAEQVAPEGRRQEEYSDVGALQVSQR